MIKSYDQEMFDFFTSEEAFLSLCKIAKHLPTVKAKLLEAFWDGVEKKLREMVSNEVEWNVVRLEPISSSISKVMLYKPSWGIAADGCPQLAVGYEKLTGQTFYGPFVHNRVSQLNHADVTTHLRGLPIVNDFDFDRSTWYPFWDHAALSFNTDEDFQQILPTKRNEHIEQFAGDLFGLGITLAAELDYCNKQFRTTGSIITQN